MSSETKLAFKKADNPFAFDLYEALIEKGVTLGKMDQGFTVLNFDGAHCTGPDVKACKLSEGDGCVYPDEIVEYALDNYDKYRDIVEGKLGQMVPWEIDDLDDKTEDDEKLRQELAGVIADIKDVIVDDMGVKKGSDEYERNLAAGIFYYIGWNILEKPVLPFPSSIFFSQSALYSPIEDIKRQLMPLKIDPIMEYVESSYSEQLGLIFSDSSKEYTLLEAIDEGRGDCTEKTLLLYKAFEMAGLDAGIMTVSVNWKDGYSLDYPKQAKAQMKQMIKLMATHNPGFNHMCAAITFGNGDDLLFDLAMNQYDPQFSEYYPMNQRHLLSYIYWNRTVYALTVEDAKKASEYAETSLLIDAANSQTLNGQAIIARRVGDYDQASILYKAASDVYPSFPEPYWGLAMLSYKDGDASEAEQYLRKYFEVGGIYFDGIKSTIEDDGADKSPLVKSSGKAIDADTNSDAAAIYAAFTLAKVLWKAGEYGYALDTLEEFVDEIKIEEKHSDKTTAFFEKMIGKLPPEMMKKKTAKALIEKLKKSL